MRTSVFHEYELILSTQGKIFFSVSWLPEKAQTIKSVAAAQSLISKMKRDAASSKAAAAADDTKSLAALVAKHKTSMESEAASPPAAAPPPPSPAASAPAPAPAPAVVTQPAPPTPTTPKLDERLKPPPALSECPEVPLLRAICMWPLALLWAPISCQALTLAFLGIALVETPPALFAALQAVWLARRFGPIGKVINRRELPDRTSVQSCVS